VHKSSIVSLSALLLAGGISLPLLASTAAAAAASPRTIPPIGKQLAELKGSDTVAGDYFGSVAISGTDAIVGAFSSGRAYVFAETGATWKQVAELKGSDTVGGDDFGMSVAISGTTAVVGAYGHAAYSGEAYVFTKTGASWKQVAKLGASDVATRNYFGSSVAISGTTAIVGAYGHNPNGAGRAYVFTKTATGWRQTAELKGSDTVATDSFGTRVAISGTTAVVGADGHANGAGRAYVFTKTGATWKQVAELKGSDTVAGDEFGWSVAISGTTAVVGARNHAKFAGGAYVFTKTGATWKQVAELKGSDTVAKDSFGSSVAISGTTAVVGATGHANGAGRAYLFTKTGATWKQVAELKGSDTVARDGFGWSVAISGNTAVVGAIDHAFSAGRAYVFEA